MINSPKMPSITISLYMALYSTTPQFPSLLVPQSSIANKGDEFDSIRLKNLPSVNQKPTFFHGKLYKVTKHQAIKGDDSPYEPCLTIIYDENRPPR